MPDPLPDLVDVSSDGGVVTARIVSTTFEERQAMGILEAVKVAMDEAGDGLRYVVLDFGEVNFINSSGLAACIELRNGADAQGARTIVYRPKDEVNEVFRMVRVDRLYTFAHSAEELEKLVS